MSSSCKVSSGIFGFGKRDSHSWMNLTDNHRICTICGEPQIRFHGLDAIGWSRRPMKEWLKSKEQREKELQHKTEWDNSLTSAPQEGLAWLSSQSSTPLPSSGGTEA